VAAERLKTASNKLITDTRIGLLIVTVPFLMPNPSFHPVEHAGGLLALLS